MAGRRGRIVSAATRKKISEALKGRKRGGRHRKTGRLQANFNRRAAAEDKRLAIKREDKANKKAVRAKIKGEKKDQRKRIASGKQRTRKQNEAARRRRRQNAIASVRDRRR